ncbi:MAG TPA: hypothetical protein VKU01_12110 [Bryobacteraceae bacterium]|nr:hypothetical protein [Bryobacteraceae bacterium]
MPPIKPIGNGSNPFQEIPEQIPKNMRAILQEEQALANWIEKFLKAAARGAWEEASNYLSTIQSVLRANPNLAGRAVKFLSGAKDALESLGARATAGATAENLAALSARLGGVIAGLGGPEVWLIILLGALALTLLSSERAFAIGLGLPSNGRVNPVESYNQDALALMGQQNRTGIPGLP